MLIGYVSDERHMALADVLLSLTGADGNSCQVRSGADGAIFAAVEPGDYEVTLACEGYGGKRVSMTVAADRPYQFRLLSKRLLGYAWPKWVRSGERSEFRVHSPEPYKLSLWRYGWEKEFIRNLGWYDDHGPLATLQITPDGDFTQSGVQWNRVGYALTWHRQYVEAPARSGLYYFHVKTLSGAFFGFPWIVQPAAARAPIAVLASNMDWNAYNNFGGRSNYVAQDGIALRPTVHARQDLARFTRPDTWPFDVHGAPLSFDRPELFNVVPEDARITDPVEGRLESAMAPAEWRLLGWLEREGFDYDLYSGTALHFGEIDLDAYRVLILNTHPEYFSKEMYLQVKRWVYERGGQLLYLGGAGLQAEVELPDHATMLCREELRTDLRQEPEATLLGVGYTHDGYQSGAPYRVLDADHWVFAGTGLYNGDRFGHRSLHERCPGGASAHELDKLSPHSPPNTRHLAKGDNAGGDGADMVLFETDSGGMVFAVGSLAWPLSIVVDEQVSQITANVLRHCLRGVEDEPRSSAD